MNLEELEARLKELDTTLSELATERGALLKEIKHLRSEQTTQYINRWKLDSASILVLFPIDTPLSYDPHIVTFKVRKVSPERNSIFGIETRLFNCSDEGTHATTAYRSWSATDLANYSRFYHIYGISEAYSNKLQVAISDLDMNVLNTVEKHVKDNCLIVYDV